jgi:two-component system, LytTR family, response regulator
LNLGKLEDRLSDHSFFRIHHRFLVNMKHSNMLSIRQDLSIMLPNNKIIKVSRRKKKPFSEFLLSEF